MGKRRDHGHHGGAWKVAYADFVTAMMALFIVLWILGSSEETKAAVSAYFQHPSIFSHGDRGFLTDEGFEKLQTSLQQIQEAEAAEESGEEAVAPPEDPGGPGSADQGLLERSANALEGLLNDSEALRNLRAQVSIEFTSQGLRVLLHDLDSHSLFAVGSARPETATRALLETVGAVLRDLPNPILIEGHTDARPYSGNGTYSNWELSADRANVARRILEDAGIAPARIARVVGYADRRPLVTEGPEDERNRRISIIVCYQGAEFD